MSLSDNILYQISKRLKSPNTQLHKRLTNEEIGAQEYEKRYALNQFNNCVERGIKRNVTQKDVLEIGCGHGGISCYLACAGAKSVIGIDINEANLEFAAEIKEFIFGRIGSSKIPLKFIVQNATNTEFDNESFDMIFAPNSFEHFTEPEAIMKESFRLLRSGGSLVVDPFSSIYCKYGAHIKYGITIPWVNLFFSDKTIIKALFRAANDDPNIYNIFPGLKNDPVHIRDIRKHKDLNDITFRSFKEMASTTGFIIEYFHPVSGYLGKIANRIPVVNRSIIIDILSYSASAILKKL